MFFATVFVVGSLMHASFSRAEYKHIRRADVMILSNKSVVSLESKYDVLISMDEADRATYMFHDGFKLKRCLWPHNYEVECKIFAFVEIAYWLEGFNVIMTNDMTNDVDCALWNISCLVRKLV